MTEPIRLHKILAINGYGSRNGMETAILNGEVTINGKLAIRGITASPGDVILLRGNVVSLDFKTMTEFPRMIVLNKVAHDETVDKIDQWLACDRVYRKIQGLLLYTDKSAIREKTLICNSRMPIEQDYAIRIYKASPHHIGEYISSYDRLEVKPVIFDYRVGERSNSWCYVRFVEPKGIMDFLHSLSQTFDVDKIIRIRYGNIKLPKGLNKGQIQEVSEEDVACFISLLA